MFKENYTAGKLVQSATSAQFFTHYFQLFNLGNLNSYQTLFDQYRIKAAVITANPSITQVTAGTNPTITYLPRLYSVLDYDDSAPPSGINGLQQYDSCIVSPAGTSISRIIKPHVAIAAYGGSAFTSYANVEDQWIDIASNTVPHYGVKFGVEPGVIGQTLLQEFNFEVVLIFETRNQR
jgi:hypothetical protein